MADRNEHGVPVVGGSDTATDVAGTATDVAGTATDVAGTATDVAGTAIDGAGTATDVAGTATDVAGTAIDGAGTAIDGAGAEAGDAAGGAGAEVEAITDAPTPARKKHKRVVRRGGEKVLESEAVESFRLKDTTPHEQPRAQGGNDARLIADVPPHWGRQ